MFSTNRITDKMSNTNGITYGLSPFKSSRELKNNYRTMPLRLIDRIINELNPLRSSRKLKNNYKTMPLRLTDGIIDELNPLKISRELKKNTGPCPLRLTNKTARIKKILSQLRVHMLNERTRTKLKYVKSPI